MTIMANQQMTAQVSAKPGFIAALDQSGGSTPGALRQYGVSENAYSNDEQMFRLIHEMRVRIITSPAFRGDRVIGAILFEATMNGEAEGRPVPSYLWENRGVVPFLKVDKGLGEEADGVRLMKPIPKLDELLARAVSLNVFGTKMRSVINDASQSGIEAIVAQQFEVAKQIAAHGLVPIIEPEVSIKSPHKAQAEQILRDQIARHLDAWSAEAPVMLKLTIPDQNDLYKPLAEHAKVLSVVALSGGYSRSLACEKLSHNHEMIASFSRALIDDLRKDMSDAQFNASLGEAIEEIYRASTQKH
jgi:fructose-bisphosphate aldolase, class I